MASKAAAAIEKGLQRAKIIGLLKLVGNVLRLLAATKKRIL
jgi:hypothetical protein